jgi:transcriptional regulator with XRE-family HTH domain
MTQVQLAKAAQVTQRAISYYETDGGSPPGPVVAQLAQALKVTADELLGIKAKPREASRFERVTSDPEKQRLWKRFQRITLLPERDQRAVIRLINSLTGTAEAHD